MSLSLWRYFLSILQNKLSPIEFSIWIRPLKIQFLKNNILELSAPNQIILDRVKQKYLSSLNPLLIAHFGSNHPILKFKIYTDFKKDRKNIFIKIKKTDTIDENVMNLSKFNIFHNFKFNKKHNFENFIEGKSNKLARSITYKIANNIKKNRYLLLLHSNSGLGKTHLLHAVGNYIIFNEKNAKVIYIDCKSLLNKTINMLKNISIEVLQKKYDTIDTFLIDNIHYFSYIKKNQLQFFKTFPMLFKNSQQIIATANCYPEEIIGLENVFESKPKWNIVIQIYPPELNTRISILIKKANERNVKLSTKIAYLIATKIKSNITDLEKILHEIIFYSDSTNQKITLNFVNKILKYSIEKKKLLLVLFSK